MKRSTTNLYSLSLYRQTTSPSKSPTVEQNIVKQSRLKYYAVMKKLKNPKTIGVRLDENDLVYLKTLGTTTSKALRRLIDDHRSIKGNGRAPIASEESGYGSRG